MNLRKSVESVDDRLRVLGLRFLVPRPSYLRNLHKPTSGQVVPWSSGPVIPIRAICVHLRYPRITAPSPEFCILASALWLLNCLNPHHLRPSAFICGYIGLGCGLCGEFGLGGCVCPRRKAEAGRSPPLLTPNCYLLTSSYRRTTSFCVPAKPSLVSLTRYTPFLS
jgi:hypothetical protein